jgi:hypothetical protein
MRISRHTLLVLLFLLPMLIWVGSVGGAPVCCWGRTCPMMAHGAQRCPMMSGSRSCAVSSGAALALPVPLIPAVPLPPRTTGVPVLSALTWQAPAWLPAPAAGWPRGVFRPPQA